MPCCWLPPHFSPTMCSGCGRRRPVRPLPPPIVQHAALRASRAIAKGATIAPDDVAVAELSTPAAPGTLADLADAEGRIAIRQIAANEILSQTNTSLAVRPATLADAVPPGLRAISLHISDNSGVSNLLHPGDHVDVLAISNAGRLPLRSGGLFPSAEVKMLLQDVPVLAVGQSMARAAPPAPARDVTLAVAPRDAETVALVQSIGREYLVLRRNGDETISGADRVTSADLALATASARDPADPIFTTPDARSRSFAALRRLQPYPPAGLYHDAISFPSVLGGPFVHRRTSRIFACARRGLGWCGRFGAEGDRKIHHRGLSRPPALDRRYEGRRCLRDRRQDLAGSGPCGRQDDILVVARQFPKPRSRIRSWSPRISER